MNEEKSVNKSVINCEIYIFERLAQTIENTGFLTLGFLHI